MYIYQTICVNRWSKITRLKWGKFTELLILIRLILKTSIHYRNIKLPDKDLPVSRSFQHGIKYFTHIVTAETLHLHFFFFSHSALRYITIVKFIPPNFPREIPTSNIRVIVSTWKYQKNHWQFIEIYKTLRNVAFFL